MFLHLQIPGFHAVVHQALHPAVRGRPVAVAIDDGPQAPLIATSPEARLQHILPGLRADAALRRCPGLVVVPPDPVAYRRAQRQLGNICGAFTRRVGGTAGRLDLDLVGSEVHWRSRLDGLGPEASPETTAGAIATSIRRRCAEALQLDVYMGGSSRLLVARLAAHLARAPHVSGRGVVILTADEAPSATDLMPITLLTECDSHTRELLDLCGISTIGQLRSLSADNLIGLVGPSGGALYESLHGLRDEAVPELADPEPSVSAKWSSATGGAGPDATREALIALAREIGFTLRQRQLACARLGLTVTWLDAETMVSHLELPGDRTRDEELARAAQRLFAEGGHHRAQVARLQLTASGLCTLEQPRDLFPCGPCPGFDRGRMPGGLPGDAIRKAAGPWASGV